MTKSSSHFGRRAEEEAARYLQDRGFALKTRNYRHGSREIDLIMEKDDLLVFVEVKASRGQSFGSPESWVTPAKQKNIITAALAYIQKHDIRDREIRFDVITCHGQGSELKLNHLPAAFDASANL